MGRLFRLLLLAGLMGIMPWRGARIGRFLLEGNGAGILSVLFLIAAIAGLAAWAIAERNAPPGAGSGFLGRFRRNRLASFGLGMMLLLYSGALLTPILAPADPNRQDLGACALSPSASHLLGTDQYGRDVLSRILYGSRISLFIGFVSVAISVTIGSLVGAVAGYVGGGVDWGLMRFVDVLLSFPRLLLLLAVIALFHPSIFLLIAVLGLTGWMGTARIVRSEVLSLKEREFVLAARALGFGGRRILFFHVLPNVIAPIIVAATLNIGNTVMLEASLSFLGLGVQPPTASWGTMINDGRDLLTSAWWLATFPGIAILFTVTGFNLVGDGLRDALDPRLRR
ncbi:MAG: ABC transporter permease [Candidatus Eisenbacteria bacterium]